MSKISPEITELSARLAKKLSTVEGKLTIDPNAYVETLPEDISVEMLKKVHDHNSVFFPAAALAVGDAAIAAMKKDKKLDSLSVEIPMTHKDYYGLTIERSHDYPNIQAKGEKITTWGNVKASLVTQAARSNRGAMSHVRDHLSAEAMKAFGK